jgi:ribonuclease P protein component
MPSPLPHARIGIVVAKHGQTNVDRNRLKRRLRELARLSLLPTLNAVDVVIYTRPDAYRASFEQLAADFLDAGKRIAAISQVR